MTQSLPAYFAKIGGDNPREAAFDLMGKFGTHVVLANGCPESNDFFARVLGRVITRRANYSEGSSQSANFGMSEGSSESRGSSSGFGWAYGSSGGHGSNNLNRNFGRNDNSGGNWGSTRGQGRSQNESRGYSESVENAIEAGDFGRSFKTGGPQNGNEVTGVWFQSGRIFKASGTNFLLARFKQ